MRSDRAIPSVRPVASGSGWRVTEVTCYAGPEHKPYEERHDWVSIAAVMQGTFTYRSRNGRGLMIPGSFLLGSAGHCFECGHEHGSGDRCVAFQFAPEVFEDIARSLRRTRSIDFRTVRLPAFGMLLPVFPRIGALLESSDPLLAEELAFSLADVAFRTDQETDAAPSSIRDEARVGTVLDTIQKNYTNSLAISDLATVSGLSRRRFASVFRHVTGVTPYQYVLNLRLKAAADRLCRGQGSVLQVALDCGFGDLSEFTRRFRTRFGMPPNRFRRSRER